jgi:rod shape-determining protein MreC
VVTLTVGSAAGVAPRSPVVAPEGVVGIVQQVDPTMSMAILWSHPDFRVSAMTVNRTALGIVQPHVGENGTDEFLELRNVALRDTLAANTLVVSSGLGSTFPRGIPVGTVVRELETPEKWARTYLLRPAVAAAEVHSVMVLRPDRVAAAVSEVWATQAAAEAAARGSSWLPTPRCATPRSGSPGPATSPTRPGSHGPPRRPPPPRSPPPPTPRRAPAARSPGPLPPAGARGDAAGPRDARAPATREVPR